MSTPVDAAAVDPARWHPVRILGETEMSRSRGFPRESRDIHGMREWCGSHVPGPWTAARDEEDHAVFWFEHVRDATAFALKWFPMKCV